MHTFDFFVFVLQIQMSFYSPIVISKKKKKSNNEPMRKQDMSRTANEKITHDTMESHDKHKT